MQGWAQLIMYILGYGVQVDKSGAIIAVGASQLANLFESFLGATLQGRPGYEWVRLILHDLKDIFPNGKAVFCHIWIGIPTDCLQP